MELEQIYGLVNKPVVPQINAIANVFTEKLFTYVSQNMMQLKYVNLVPDEQVTHPSVVNACMLPPLGGSKDCDTIVDEIAKYRWGALALDGASDGFWTQRTNLLFMDYLLSAFVCYVEVFDANSGKKTNMVEKFFATRNRHLAANLAEVPDDDTIKYTNYLTSTTADYRHEALRVLKLAANKKGYKINQPKVALNFKKNIRITPMFIMTAFAQCLVPVLKGCNVRFTYMKDNTQERELLTTLSKETLSYYYDKEYAEKVIKDCELVLKRGYVRLPELGCSRYDDSGMRALNLTRIIKIEAVTQFETRYINVDLSTTIPMFKATVGAIKQPEAMSFLYNNITGENPTGKTLYDLREALNTYIDNKYSLGTTTFVRQLHDYMVSMPMVFQHYTGKPMTAQEKVSAFDLGVSEIPDTVPTVAPLQAAKSVALYEDSGVEDLGCM